MVDFPVRYEKNNQNGKVFQIILMARHGQTLIFSSQSSDSAIGRSIGSCKIFSPEAVRGVVPFRRRLKHGDLFNTRQWDFMGYKS